MFSPRELSFLNSLPHHPLSFLGLRNSFCTPCCLLLLLRILHNQNISAELPLPYVTLVFFVQGQGLFNVISNHILEHLNSSERLKIGSRRVALPYILSL